MPFSSFRFYFVGDEDLLEIIGNSKNVPKLQKHFKKMFAGVASVILDEEATKVLGVCSREGEQVRILYQVPSSLTSSEGIVRKGFTKTGRISRKRTFV